MPWYIQLCLGFLVGYAVTNSWLRHYALTLIIWISKGLQWVLSSVVWVCELIQDKFDDLDYVPDQNISQQKVYNQKIRKSEPEKTKEPIINFETATTEEIYKFINDHPEKIRVNHKVGE